MCSYKQCGEENSVTLYFPEVFTKNKREREERVNGYSASALLLISTYAMVSRELFNIK